MGAIIVSLQNEVTFRSNSPTAAEIESALKSIPIVAARAQRAAANMPDDGGFVGPARITRVTNAFAPGGRITNVAWLYTWPDRTTPALEATFTRQITDYLKAQANAKVAALDPGNVAGFGGPAWKPAVITPYNPAVNGALDWWESGAASHTQTRDQFDLNQQIGSNSADNPTGPTTTRPPSLSIIPDISPQAQQTLKTLAIAAVAIGALFYLGPIVSEYVAGKRMKRRLISQL